MTSETSQPPIAILLSGGLDSCILLGKLIRDGRAVQPIFIRGGLAWEAAEWAALLAFLGRVTRPGVSPVIALDMPLTDLYGDHWSITGRSIPGADTPDEAVFLPGRNPLLLVKAAVWCQMHRIEELALAPLASNPFGDASDRFFDSFATTMTYAMSRPLRIVRPFLSMHKRDVMRLGRDMPLQHTFSCIAPVRKFDSRTLDSRDLHCGACNKCAERQAAFRDAEIPDPTVYHVAPRRPG